ARSIAIIASLAVLVYIGIRMAIASVATDKAKYKNMIVSWLQSFILIFILHYIIYIAMYLEQQIINILVTGYKNIEWTLFTNAVLGIFTEMGTWNTVVKGLTFWILVICQAKFFYLYVKRLLSIAFLIIIAPLITITYAIDKVRR
ncbi:MAG: hypothetical protein LBL91_05085, partial [Lachnospiraceae bacterium]|nr:hypothetical protein [Lachnospiraceae bacterium]